LVEVAITVVVAASVVAVDLEDLVVVASVVAVLGVVGKLS
jgi:hypothetical protein